MISTKRTHCISCGSLLPGDIVLIGDQFPSAIFLDPSQPPPKELESSSLNVTRCANEDCALIQLSHEYDLQYVFDHYPYESGNTATMRRILQDVLDDVLSIAPLGERDVILDIGGNDGTLLSLVPGPVRARVNIDAAAGVTQVVQASNYHHIHAKYSAARYQSLDLPSPTIITSVAMFYHLNDPLGFCREVAEIMNDDSVWVLQMTYGGTMLKNNIFDNIVHEHVGYYSLYSAEALLKRVGLSIAEARLVASYGGSLRLFIVKRPERFPAENYRRDYSTLQRFEAENRTNSFEALYAFDSRTQLLRDTLSEQVTHLARHYGPLWGFGASTKGNMILQFLGLDARTIPAILDNGQKKIGTVTTGSLIPIIDEAAHMTDLPPYLFVLPYYYTETFAKIIARQLPKDRQVHLFVPLPHPQFRTVRA